MSSSYTVTAPMGLALPPQTPVKLTKKQLALRSRQVVKGKSGFYTSTDFLTFKQGEAIVVEGTLPKNLAALAAGSVAGEVDERP